MIDVVVTKLSGSKRHEIGMIKYIHVVEKCSTYTLIVTKCWLNGFVMMAGFANVRLCGLFILVLIVQRSTCTRVNGSCRTLLGAWTWALGCVRCGHTNGGLELYLVRRHHASLSRNVCCMALSIFPRRSILYCCNRNSTATEINVCLQAACLGTRHTRPAPNWKRKNTASEAGISEDSQAAFPYDYFRHTCGYLIFFFVSIR